MIPYPALGSDHRSGEPSWTVAVLTLSALAIVAAALLGWWSISHTDTPGHSPSPLSTITVDQGTNPDDTVIAAIGDAIDLDQ